MSAHDHGDDVERGDKTPGGAIHVYAVPSRWQPVGHVAARLTEKKTRERLAPRAGQSQPQL